ncbi:MAG TPA: hypothetical protein VF228_01495 [Iamia sp.]
MIAARRLALDGRWLGWFIALLGPALVWFETTWFAAYSQPDGRSDEYCAGSTAKDCTHSSRESIWILGILVAVWAIPLVTGFAIHRTWRAAPDQRTRRALITVAKGCPALMLSALFVLFSSAIVPAAEAIARST